jgi:glycosyltransferase involved in cell wall biosynthesis
MRLDKSISPSTRGRKKIAIVAVFFPPQAIGGGTRVVTDNIDLLIDEHGHEFDLVVFTSDASQQTPHSIHLYTYRGVRVYRAGILWRPHMDWQPQDPKMGELFAKLLDHEKPDIVHFHSVQRMSASIVETTLKKGIPYFVTIHDAWWISDFQFLVDENDRVYPNGHPDPFESFEPPKGISVGESLARRTYLKRLLNQAERVLIVSEAFAKIYAANGIERITVNKNGIKPRRWLTRVPSASGRVRLGHIGGMSAHKGYHIFKEALSSHPFQNLEAIVVDLGAPKGSEVRDMWGTVPVTFVGKTPQEEIDQLYARMDVLVAPSIWPESYGLVTREASAAGVWVVASNMGGIGEDVLEGSTGNVIKPTLEMLIKSMVHIEKLGVKAVAMDDLPIIRSVAEQVKELCAIYHNTLDK